MSRYPHKVIPFLVAIAFIGTIASSWVDLSAASNRQTGFLVLAPDRGFMGNEETRAAFRPLAEERNAVLAFVTDERTEATIDHSLETLEAAGAQKVIVLPLFVSTSNSRYIMAKTYLQENVRAQELRKQNRPIQFARSFGESYLAVEILADRVREITNPGDHPLVIVGNGAASKESRQLMEESLKRLAQLATQGFGFPSVKTIVWYDARLAEHHELNSEVENDFKKIMNETEGNIVIPYHLGTKLDGMMSLTSHIRRLVPAGNKVLSAEVTPHPLVATWMQREANRHSDLQDDEIGVVFLAHGADFHWNETMRQAVGPLTVDYKIEFAFCMADAPIIESAIQRLEQRGAKGIVIVRVFGQSASFKSTVDRMIGLDVEAAAANPHAHHAAAGGHGHGHGHGMSMGPPRPRIRSAAVIATVGGLEDNPLFAAALLSRAQDLSENPERETVILVAHGSGDDSRNKHWKDMLHSLTTQMHDKGGDKFQEIRVATWREDWPDKRSVEITALRHDIEKVIQEGGSVIVIPARTTGRGAAREFLEGLDFKLGSGFAPHPLFTEWVESQIKEGTKALGRASHNSQEIADRSRARSTSPVHDHHGHN